MSGRLEATAQRNLARQQGNSLSSALLQLYLSAFSALPGLLQALIWRRLLSQGGAAGSQGRVWPVIGPPVLLLLGLSLQLTAVFTIDRLGPDWQRLGRQSDPAGSSGRTQSLLSPLPLSSALPRALTASAAFGFVLQTDLSWQAGLLSDQADSLWPLILAAAFYWLFFSACRWLSRKIQTKAKAKAEQDR